MIINNIDVTSVISSLVEIVIGIICTVISTKLIPWLKSKLDAKQLDFIKEIVQFAVKAAEQLFESTDGQKKLEYAINLVKTALATKNIKLDDDVLNGYIEAAVLELHQAINNGLAGELIVPAKEEK